MVASCGYLLRISEMAMVCCMNLTMGLIVVGWKELWTHSFGAVVAFLYGW